MLRRIHDLRVEYHENFMGNKVYDDDTGKRTYQDTSSSRIQMPPYKGRVVVILFHRRWRSG